MCTRRDQHLHGWLHAARCARSGHERLRPGRLRSAALAAEVGKKYVIIGNGIAGTTCAQELRKNDAACDIWLITNEPHPLYNRVSLPRFLQGVLPEQKVFIRDFAWHEQQRLTLLTETLVTRVDTEQRVVYLDHGGPLRY